MGQDREIMIDDTDANIRYSGNWVPSTGITASSTGGGPAYMNTLHGTTQNTGFSYTFTGSQVTVVGSAYNTSESDFPSWQCVLDGAKVGSRASFSAFQQRQTVCTAGSLSTDQPHIISVQIIGNPNQAFFLDYIRYIPAPDVPLNNAVIRVGSDDSGLTFGPGWQDGSSKTTAGGVFNSEASATATFTFTGNSISWWGYTLKDPSLGSSPGAGTYSIDGGEPIAFKIPGLPSSSSPSQLNEEFFNTGTLSDGQHRVEVVYQGSSGNAPLALGYILLQGDTTAAAASISSSSSSPPGTQVLSLSPAAQASVPSSSEQTSSLASSPGQSSISSSPGQFSIPSSPLKTQTSTLSSSAQSSNLPQNQTQGSHHTNIGIVAGTTIGGLCILIFLLFCFLHHRRSRLRRRRYPVESVIEPFARSSSSNPNRVSPSTYEPEKSRNITNTITTTTTNTTSSDLNLPTSLFVLNPTAMNRQQLAHLEALVTYTMSDSQQRLLSSINNTAETSGPSQRDNRARDEPPNYYT